ncbi:hypothetical protein [Variovorax terrae]|nr:hypothetical protein [Variovorax terrae]
MLSRDLVIQALKAYRDRLKQRGEVAKADAVERCIAIVRKL